MGRVLELVDDGFEQQDDEKMSEDVGSGGAFIVTRRSLQADQAFEAFEREFDAPAQAIESEDIAGGEAVGAQRSDQNQSA